ncbi:folylpolyglutamate synthase [Leuconostoc suionicum]|nr:Mur ligase family protein [Leuconostoc suionicum]API71795.1 bifunctional folylpolyglutamate synthase/dihydrofolate synthase [Leuconostoc suionicum]BAX70374.1 folylpolyglutamate synthase [Leuconostoc suionicum]
MDKKMDKSELKVATRYKTVLKSLDNTWRILDEGRVAVLKEVLMWLGHPDKSLKIIHIAGTNGKGSTGTMLGSILKANGYTYGHFSSPYIMDDREQIRINGEMISKSDFLKYYDQIVALFKQHDVPLYYLSYFEYFTIISLLAFVDKKVDLVIFESGLGGLWDATNAIEPPMLTVFTKISIDHQNLLGHNIAEIAENKAAIIKPGIWVIDYPGQDIEAKKVLKARTEKVGARWFEHKRDEIIIANTSPSGLDLIINGKSGYFLSMAGAFQVHNFSIVLKTKAALIEKGYQFDAEKTRNGIANVKMLGRMNYHADKNILFDAAHNVDGIQGLVSALNSWHLKIKPTLILGVLKDKDYHEMLDEIIPFVQRVITVTPNNKTRALSADELATDILSNYPSIEVEIANDASAAISLAMRVRESSQALIVVTGSFYTLSAIHREGRI